MDHFDEWATDRRITRRAVTEFAEDPSRVGERFLGDYTVVTTSGTSNRKGLFVVDETALAVNMALSSGLMVSWLGTRGALRALGHGGRIAFVIATGGHMLVNVGAARMSQGRMGNRVRVLSVHSPLKELVAELNDFQPAVLVAYASTMALLTGEQEAGRLSIGPVLIQPAGETVPPETAARMTAAFGSVVRDTYGCGECPFLSAGCAHGWYHVNSDQVILEPVDAQHRPVAAGEPSHSVLLSNLANAVQPILRYDLGDSVVVRPDPCGCGNPLPAVRVNGRVSETLWLPGPNGERVAVTSMMIGTVLPHIDGIALYQIVRHGETHLRLRTRITDGADAAAVVGRACRELAELCRRQGAVGVTVEPDDRDPVRSAGGKYRRIIAD